MTKTPASDTVSPAHHTAPALRAALAALVVASLAVADAAGTSVTVARPPAAALYCPAASGAVPAAALAAGRSLADCQLAGRVVSYHGVAVQVPAAGTGVFAVADSATGPISLSVSTSATGVVTAGVDAQALTGTQTAAKAKAAAATKAKAAAATKAKAAAATKAKAAVAAKAKAAVAAKAKAAAAAAAAAGDPACKMTDGVYKGYSWDPAGGAAQLLVNTTSGLPGNISGATFLAVEQAAAAHLSAAYNNCGIVYHPNLALTVAGTTTLHSSIDPATNSCGPSDGSSVIDFGTMSGFPLALTCTYFSYSGTGPKRITEVDIRFATNGRSWVTTLAGCTGARYDLLGVATHEMGHGIGLGHVADVGDNDATMSYLIAPCNASAQTLGLGDITAMKLAY